MGKSKIRHLFNQQFAWKQLIIPDSWLFRAEFHGWPGRDNLSLASLNWVWAGLTMWAVRTGCVNKEWLAGHYQVSMWTHPLSHSCHGRNTLAPHTRYKKTPGGYGWTKKIANHLVARSLALIRTDRDFLCLGNAVSYQEFAHSPGLKNCYASFHGSNFTL